MKFEIDGYGALREALLSITAQIAGMGISEETVFDCKLVVDELVSNVLQHGGGKAYLLVECGREIRIAVRGDKKFIPPDRSVCSSVTAERGRGLYLVDALSLSRRYSDEEGILVTISVK